MVTIGENNKEVVSACDECLALLVACAPSKHGYCCPTCGKYEWPLFHGKASYFAGFKGYRGD